MKLNLRPIPLSELPLQGQSAICYETARTDGNDPSLCDFHLTLYREEEITAWLTLCPTKDPDTLQVCNRYMSEHDECTATEEKALEYLESWARKHGYKKLFVHACETSVPFYLRIGYRQEGEPFYEDSVQFTKLIKTL